MKYILGCLAVGAFMLTGCDDAEYDVLKNQAFILQTGTNANSSEKLTVGTSAVSTSINVRLSDVATTTNKYRLGFDEAALEAYNKEKARLQGLLAP